MPELPEVETIKLGLQKYLIGHKIIEIEIINPKSLEGNKKDAIGAKVKDIRRFGKGLVIDLSNSHSMAIHIKMTGQLIYKDKNTENVQVDIDKVGKLPSKYTRVIFYLDKDSTLFFNDMRKFGWIKILPTEKVNDLPFFKNLGPEPFKDLDENLFIEIVSKSNLGIKVLIMDQKKISGVGNIYANDALFLAKVDPRRKGKSLNENEMKILYESILKVMEKSMKFGGSSENTYVNVLGQSGNYQRHSLVYGKKGKDCPNRNGKIQKISLGGRGTFFCSTCQV